MTDEEVARACPGFTRAQVTAAWPNVTLEEKKKMCPGLVNLFKAATSHLLPASYHPQPWYVTYKTELTIGGAVLGLGVLVALLRK